MHEYDISAVDLTVYTVICGHICVLLKGYTDLK